MELCTRILLLIQNSIENSAVVSKFLTEFCYLCQIYHHTINEVVHQNSIENSAVDSKFYSQFCCCFKILDRILLSVSYISPRYQWIYKILLCVLNSVENSMVVSILVCKRNKTKFTLFCVFSKFLL